MFRIPSLRVPSPHSGHFTNISFLFPAGDTNEFSDRPIGVYFGAPPGGATKSSRILNPTPWGLKLRTSRRAKLSQMRTLRVYAGKRFVIQAVQADWSRATTVAAVSP